MSSKKAKRNKLYESTKSNQCTQIDLTLTKYSIGLDLDLLLTQSKKSQSYFNKKNTYLDAANQCTIVDRS